MNNKIDRKIALDIETTGLNKSGTLYKNHKIIEIGAVEIINRKITNNKFHYYLNPDRKINREAFKIHGISDSYLFDKPRFYEIYFEFLNYISNSEIIAHNAKFDISFLNYEIKKLDDKYKNINEFCKIIDTLDIARRIFPGKKNNLDVLCNRYSISSKKREIHSAEADAFLVAKLYLRMTSVQKKINLNNFATQTYKIIKIKKDLPLKILKASFQEEQNHISYIKNMKQMGKCLWMN